jgi:hypothetical protein
MYLRLELCESTAGTDGLSIGDRHFGETKRLRRALSRLGGAEPSEEAPLPRTATHSRTPNARGKH